LPAIPKGEHPQARPAALPMLATVALRLRLAPCQARFGVLMRGSFSRQEILIHMKGMDSRIGIDSSILSI
jgi:hypothetical protein